MKTLTEFILEIKWCGESDGLLVGNDEFDCDISDLYEMANIRERQSGIPWVIYVSSKDAALSKHGPRVKVSNKKDRWDPMSNFVITIPELRTIGQPHISQDQLEDIKDWIKVNKELLLKYWNKDIDDQELLNSIIKI